MVTYHAYAGSLGTNATQSGTGADSSTMKAGWFPDNQKQQRSQTVRPERPKIGTRKQMNSRMSGRLSYVGLTFDQLLATYMKKDIPHNQPVKQSKSIR
jgi:phage tail tape-measure protein